MLTLLPWTRAGEAGVEKMMLRERPHQGQEEALRDLVEGHLGQVVETDKY